MESNNIQINQKIIELQDDIVPLVQQMFYDGKICFTSDFYEAAENCNSWKLKREIQGKLIVSQYTLDPEKYFELGKRICDDYQKVLSEYLKKLGNENVGVLEEGRKKLFGNLFKWSGLIIEAGFIGHEEISSISQEFERIIEKRGEEFFGYFHGNIIGDHIFIDEKGVPYLLGMRFGIYPGKGYYDFLRTLDWIFLKSESNEENFQRLIAVMRKNLMEFDWEEIKLVFSLRMIGILGWDMLQRGDYGVGDKEQKIKYLLKFIRREYL